MSVSNCTFNWSVAQIFKSDGISLLNDKKTYLSNCHQNDENGAYKIDTTVAYAKKTTATYAEFMAFDSINIYYNDTLYYSINPTNAATVGFTPLTFFSGKMDAYPFKSTENFNEVTGYTANSKPFSTVDYQLFIAKFQGDYSYLTGTVIDAKDAVACKLFFTSLNEAVCKLRNTTIKDTPEDFFLVLKNAAGNVVLKHAFTRLFAPIGAETDITKIKTLAGQTVERTPISWTIPPAPPATDSKSNPIMTTSFVIDLRDNSTKTLNLKDDTCKYVDYVIQSNGSTVVSGNNAANAAKTKGYCFVTVTSTTNALVPWTDFVLNATLQDGSVYISTKAKLTPRMISDWAANSANGSALVIALSDINKSGLTGGEVAAIVIGSCAGALLLALLAGIFIRWCAYGCMNPAMVAAPKMMM